MDFSSARFKDAETAHEKSSSGKSPKKDSDRKQKRRKAMASIIVDQVGGAIGQVAFKNTSREGNLASARKLARKLFGALSDVYPPRSHLIVEGMLPLYPYFGPRPYLALDSIDGEVNVKMNNGPDSARSTQRWTIVKIREITEPDFLT